MIVCSKNFRRMPLVMEVLLCWLIMSNSNVISLACICLMIRSRYICQMVRIKNVGPGGHLFAFRVVVNVKCQIVSSKNRFTHELEGQFMRYCR